MHPYLTSLSLVPPESPPTTMTPRRPPYSTNPQPCWARRGVSSGRSVHLSVGGRKAGIGQLLSNTYCTTLQRKSHLCSPRKGFALPQSQFPHSRVCERFIFSGSVHILSCSRSWEVAHSNRKFGTEAAQFLHWEYLFRIFGNVSLQYTVGKCDSFLPL